MRLSLLSKRNALVLALTAILLAGCAETPVSGSGSSPAPSASPSPSAGTSREPPSRIVALTEQGDIVVIDRESMQQVRTVASFPPYEDPEVSAGSFWPVDVTALPDGRVLLATCCEPAAGLLYVIGEDGRRMENQDLFALDAAADPAGERLATGEIIGLVIRSLPSFSSPTATLDLPTGQEGLAPEDLSWSPDGSRVLFTIGGRLGVVDASSRSLSEAIYADAPPGSYWAGAAYTVEGPVAVTQPGEIFQPSGPSRLVRVGPQTGQAVELVPTEGQIADLTVDASGQYLLWVEDGRLRWLIDDEISTLDGEFLAAAWVTAP
jgi:hypothetical protein